LTESQRNATIAAMMIDLKAFKALTAGLLVMVAPIPAFPAEDQAKAIIASLDPKSMNELFQIYRSQPDAALTNIMPLRANTFRFLFIWPASNPVMTYERVGRSFVDRFLAFADQMKLLATGFCLPSKSMYFGSTSYGQDEVNVAYRDIEVRYGFGFQASCPGRYIAAAELDRLSKVKTPPVGFRPGLPPETSAPPPSESPEESLKPLLNPPPLPSGN
jgi:hypothetical protein